MTHLLRWRPAVREDRRALKNFECTVPGHKEKVAGKWVVVHPRLYELKVQAKVRNLEPPLKAPCSMWVGEDSKGIAAVLVLEELDGPSEVELCWGAVATRMRGKGGDVALEMMRLAFDEITARAIETGEHIVCVSAQIHADNHNAQALAHRSGLTHTADMADPDSAFQWWSGYLLVDGFD